MKILHTVAALFLGLLILFPAAQAADEKYRFVMVSHIGAHDPNSRWLTLSLDAFEEKYPDVKTEYLATPDYSVQKLVQILESVIPTNPDGIAIPIQSQEALDVPLREAIDAGIPVVAFNIPDTRSAEERIPYLTYVGGDEYLTGVKLGQHALKRAAAGDIPKPKKLLCTTHDAAHQGLKERCRGMKDAMKKAGVSISENLFISNDPAEARNILTAKLSSDKDINVLFTTASFTSPWAWKVADDLGLSPDADNKGMTIITVDASPDALRGVKLGRVLATNSQGFWLQGYLPMEWLYWYHELGYEPQSDILTGPVVVHSETIDAWEKLVRETFGPKEYDDRANAW